MIVGIGRRQRRQPVRQSLHSELVWRAIVSNKRFRRRRHVAERLLVDRQDGAALRQRLERGVSVRARDAGGFRDLVGGRRTGLQQLHVDAGFIIGEAEVAQPDENFLVRGLYMADPGNDHSIFSISSGCRR